MKKCPFCSNYCIDSASVCKCGYFFDKEALDEKRDDENKVAEIVYNSTKAKEVKLANYIIGKGAIAGILCVILGSLFIILNFISEIFKETIVGLGLIAVGLMAIMNAVATNRKIKKGTDDVRFIEEIKRD